MIEVTLLTEDELSAAVADCLLKELGIRFSCHHIRRGGFGYIRKKNGSLVPVGTLSSGIYINRP